MKVQLIYLSQAQFLPYERLASCFNEQFDIPISPGSIESFNRKAYDDLEKFEAGIGAKCKVESVVGVDGTGINVLEKLFWLHSIGSPKFSLLQAHAKRGSEAIDERNILPNFAGVVCHDHWKA